MPKPPKTVKTYLKMAALMETVSDLKGYENLSESDRYELSELCALISNQIGELSPELQKICNETTKSE